MTRPEPNITVKVDVTNPGQFFACCGLLELADRLWPGAEGWFGKRFGKFVIQSITYPEATLDELIQRLKSCDISGLTKEEKQEREFLEKEQRRLKDANQELTREQEERRKELGTKARAGELTLGLPFVLVLDWWQVEDDETATPKTWAGKQELHRITRAAQDATPSDRQHQDILDHRVVMRLTADYHKKKSDQGAAVEPFYFDARRFAHALDAGFSLDTQDAETAAHPAVELLTLVGLQRFRPHVVSKRCFRYGTWTHPLPPGVASAVTCGAIAGATTYEFHLLSRDNQERYKAFDFATPIGDQS